MAISRVLHVAAPTRDDRTRAALADQDRLAVSGTGGRGGPEPDATTSGR